MAKNLEIKVKLNSHRRIKKILSENKIELVEILSQKDIYYKIDKGLLKLRIENGKKTLIFYNRDENAAKRWSDYFLLDMSNQNAEEFLEKFLHPTVVVKKRRELYLYNNTRIHLDKVANLGYFLELETRVVKGINDAVRRFNFLVDLLELKKYPEIRDSYKNLILKKSK